MDFRGKCCLVTGAARGVGKAICEALCKRGAKCVVADVAIQAGQETVSEMECKYGAGCALFLRTDVASRVSFEEALDFCVDQFGSVDIVVNNAGTNGENNWESIIDINLKGCSHGVSLGLSYMGRQGKNNKAANRTGGVILNIGSIHGLVSMPMMPFYSATKAGINALTRIAGGKEQFGEHGDVLKHFGMNDAGWRYWKGFDYVDRLIELDEMGDGAIEVLEKGASGSVWYQHQFGDRPYEVRDDATWENLLGQKPKKAK